MTKSKGKSRPRAGAPEPESTASPIGKQVVLGMGLLLVAFVLWEVCDLVPSWAAQSVTANVEFATTTERDDARITRAFETAMRTVAADADLEPLPNPTQVRHTRLTVRAPTSAEAIAQATALAEATAAAFSRGGEDTLSVNVRRRTIPVPDSTTILLGNALRIGAGAAGVLGLALIALGCLRLQSGPDRLPRQIWYGIGCGTAVILAPILLPGEIIVALMVMAIPMLLAGLILWKTMQVRAAATWPSTRARIIKSQLRAQHQRRAEGVTEIVNVPAIEYEFPVSAIASFAGRASGSAR